MLKMVREMWKISSQVTVNGRIPLVLYRSKRSALRVAVAEVPGPMVRGMVSFVTETQTDEGLPHTLEHLVFMGSKSYPYKGVLDMIANRCLASGTNACTDQDHTYYSLDTVGNEGFRKILPVYINHLLSPSLTDAQFTTEVHHINGDGEDGGVVYSEMQDNESDMGHLVSHRCKQLLYPHNTSYRVQTGGLLPAIRTECTAPRIRQYHSQYYHLKNMMITVCGQINHDQLLECIEPVETEELAKIPHHFPRPFTTQVVPLQGQHCERVICPADDDTKGMVEMAWLGPPATDLYTGSALLVLFDYLTNTSVAPLEQDFVQTADPYCSSVYLSLSEQTTCEVTATFSGVPVAKLGEIKDRFFTKSINDHKAESFFDMERMGFIIEQRTKKYLSKMENNPASEIFSAFTGYQIYGVEEDNSAELHTRLNEIDTLHKLRNEPATFWQHLMQNTFSSDNVVCVMGEPSTKAVEEYEEKEEARVNAQRERLGEEGLKSHEAALKEAIHENTANKPSDEVLAELIVKDFQHFNLFNVVASSNISNTHNHPVIQQRQHLSNAIPTFIDKLPFPAVLHNAPTDFIEVVVLIDTKEVPTELRHYLMLWFDLIFQSPAVVNGKLLSFEEVSKLSTKDLVSNSVIVGVSGSYDRFTCLRLKVDSNGYSNLAKWAKIYLHDIVFDASRVAICAKKLANAAADYKRHGNSMNVILSNYFTSPTDSNSNFYNYLSLELAHKGIAEAVEREESKAAVMSKLEQVRAAVLKCPVNVHFICDPSKVEVGDVDKHIDGWNFLLQSDSPTNEIFEGLSDSDTTWSHCGEAHVMAVGGTESSFLLQKCEFDQDWSGIDVMPTLLLAQYFSQCEGPLWNSVRGAGLAYGADIYVMPDNKAITLSLYRCAHLEKAYTETANIVMSILNENKLEEREFEAAKRSLVCDLIGAQGNVKSAAQSSLLATLRQLPPKFTLDLCRKIWDSDASTVLAQAAPHFRRLFDPSLSIRSMVVNPSKLDEVMKAFPDRTTVVKLEQLQVYPPKY